MEIEKHIGAGWRLMASRPLFVLGGGLIVQAVNVASFGILSGPLVGGFLLCLIRHLRDNEQLSLSELFCGFKKFSALLPYAVIGLLVLAGFFFFVIPGFVFMAWWLYALPLMADRGLPMGRAMAASRDTVRRAGFWPHMSFVLIITIVPNMAIHLASLVLPFLEVLQVALLPFQCGCLASLYVEEFGQQGVAAQLEMDNE